MIWAAGLPDVLPAQNGEKVSMSCGLRGFSVFFELFGLRPGGGAVSFHPAIPGDDALRPPSFRRPFQSSSPQTGGAE